MKIFTIEDLRSFKPCYDPTKYLPENWSGTAVDILNVNNCPPEDKLWVILRKQFMTDRELRLFAVWCARTLKEVNNSEILTNTVNVSEKFADNLATQEELKAARDAAWDAARDAALHAARDAAWDAARHAALHAACHAAWDAAWHAALHAARDAAWDAAWHAARDAARDAQIQKLIEFFSTKNYVWVNNAK